MYAFDRRAQSCSKESTSLPTCQIKAISFAYTKLEQINNPFRSPVQIFRPYLPLSLEAFIVSFIQN